MHRLVTVTGPGGMGKTRFAFQFASAHASDFPGGTWFVRLSAIDDSSLVAQAVADALLAPRGPAEPIEESVVEFLGERRALLLLDEAEHVAAGVAGFVRRILPSCPNLRIVVTSRAPVTVAGERALPLGPLDAGTSLFLERVLESHPDLAITDKARQLIDGICRRLDGVPLAIELAAAQIATLASSGTAQSVERLDRHLAAYEVVPDAAQPTEAGHFRALAAMLDWSYRSLTPLERRFFARLGAFAGSFTVSACEAIAYEASPEEDPAAALDALVGKALVKCTAGLRGPRFDLHPIVREFAVAALAKARETAETRKRFCDYYCNLACGLEAQPGTDVVDRIESTSLEWENIRSALRTTLEQRGNVEAGAAAVLALNDYWTESGRLADGWYWILNALEVVPAGPRHAELLYAAAVNAHARGDFVELDTLSRQLVEIYEREKDALHLGRSLNGLANARYRLGDSVEAEALYRRALEQYRIAGDRRSEATALMNLGALLADRRLDYAHAREFFLESLAIFGEFGPSRNVGTLLANLAEIDSREGDHARALAYAEKSRAVFDRLGNKGLAAWQLVNMAQFHVERREFADALEALHEARPALQEQLTTREHAAAYFDAAFMLAADLLAFEAAARIYGYAQQFRELYRAARSPSEESVVDPRHSLILNALRAEKIERLMAEGAAFDEAAVDRQIDLLAPLTH